MLIQMRHICDTYLHEVNVIVGHHRKHVLQTSAHILVSRHRIHHSEEKQYYIGIYTQQAKII